VTPVQLPNPPWYRRWSVILAGVIGVAAITALLGWRGMQQTASPSPTSQATSTTARQEATTTRSPVDQTEPTAATSRPGVLWEGTGSDTHRSRLFRAPPSWRIIWSFDCSDFAGGGGGNFKLSGDGAFADVQIQAFDVKASGSRSVTGGGYGRLIINSVCDHWKVQAVRA
jgi:hypothetical protein